MVSSNGIGHIAGGEGGDSASDVAKAVDNPGAGAGPLGAGDIQGETAAAHRVRPKQEESAGAEKKHDQVEIRIIGTAQQRNAQQTEYQANQHDPHGAGTIAVLRVMIGVPADKYRADYTEERKYGRLQDCRAGAQSDVEQELGGPGQKHRTQHRG